jgi:hypothetical protein
VPEYCRQDPQRTFGREGCGGLTPAVPLAAILTSRKANRELIVSIRHNFRSKTQLVAGALREADTSADVSGKS